MSTSTKSNLKPKLMNKQVKNVLEKKPTKTKLKLYDTVTSRMRRELHFGSSSSDTKMKNNEVGGRKTSKMTTYYTTSTYPSPYASPQSRKKSGYSRMATPSSIKKSTLAKKDNLSNVKIYLNQVKLPLMIKLDWRTSQYTFVEMDSQFPDIEEMTRYYPDYDGDVDRSYTKLTAPADANNCSYCGKSSRKLKVPKSIKIGRIFDPYLKFWPIEIEQEAIDLMDQHLREQIEPRLPPQLPQNPSIKIFGPEHLMRWT